MSSARRFPPPWSVEELAACFVVRDGAGQKLAFVYFEDEPVRRTLWDLTTFRRDGPPSHRNRDFAVFAEIGRVAGDPGLEEFKCGDSLAGRSIPQLCG